MGVAGVIAKVACAVTAAKSTLPAKDATTVYVAAVVGAPAIAVLPA